MEVRMRSSHARWGSREHLPHSHLSDLGGHFESARVLCCLVPLLPWVFLTFACFGFGNSLLKKTMYTH